MKKVLIVDDENTIREGLCHAVPWQENGFSVVGTAKNGTAALSFMKTNDVDLVISDIKMPMMDGITLLRTTRNHGFLTPFIFISGYDEFEFAQQAINNGAFAYILKPIDVDELLSILKRALQVISNSKQSAPVMRDTQNGQTCNFISYQTIAPSEDEIVELLLSGNAGGAQQALRRQLEVIVTHNLHLDDVRLFARNLFFKFLRGLPHSEQTDNISIPANSEFIFTAVSAEDLLEKLYGVLHDISKRATPMEYGHMTGTIVEAKKFIDTHYADPSLSLSAVAAHVGLNPSYFSSEFAKCEGMCLIDYLTNLRIRKARHMLTYTTEKISTISESVGYINATYFSTLFKRTTGISPSLYRTKP